MTRLLSSLPAPLRAAIVAFALALPVLLGLACFAVMSFAPLTSTLPPAIVIRAACALLALFVAAEAAIASDGTPRGRK